MLRVLNIAAAFLLLLLLELPRATSTGSTSQSSDGHDLCAHLAEIYDPAIVYFPDTAQLTRNAAGSVTKRDHCEEGHECAVTVTVAEDFEVQYFNSYKLVSNFRSGQDFVLYQCGTPAPTNAAYVGRSFFEVPVRKVLLASTVPVKFMELLSAIERIVGVDMTYVTSACVQHTVEECGLTEHMPAYDAEWSTAITDADMVITDKWSTGASGTSKDVAFDASSDPGLLHRAEWIKFLSLFLNLEHMANQLFDAESAQVLEYKAAAEAASGRSPLVAWISHNAEYISESNPEWNSAATWVISAAEYKTEFTAWSGGINMNFPQLASTAVVSRDGDTYSWPTSAELKTVLQGVEIVIDETYPTNGDYFGYVYSTFLQRFGFSANDGSSGAWPFLTNQKVFRFDKALNDGEYGEAYGADWFESNIARPSQAMSDLLYVMNPTAFSEHSNTSFFRNIAIGETCKVVSAVHCEGYYRCCNIPNVLFCGGACCETCVDVLDMCLTIAAV